MLDFERLNGFVVDMSTQETTLNELDAVIHSKEDRDSLIEELSLEDLRYFILEYYLDTYKDAYIFMKAPNVFQVVEEDLEVANNEIRT